MNNGAPRAALWMAVLRLPSKAKLWGCLGRAVATTPEPLRTPEPRLFALAGRSPCPHLQGRAAPVTCDEQTLNKGCTPVLLRERPDLEGALEQRPWGCCGCLGPHIGWLPTRAQRTGPGEGSARACALARGRQGKARRETARAFEKEKVLPAGPAASEAGVGPRARVRERAQPPPVAARLGAG